MIKQEQVPGAKKDDFMSTRPVMTCDSKGCDSKLSGNAGSRDEDFLRSRANSLGWMHDPNKSKDYCPDHAGAMTATKGDDGKKK